MLYDHPIGLLHVKHPHDSRLTVLVITGLPSLGYQPYSVGLQKHVPQHFISRGRDCQGLEKTPVSDLYELPSKNTTGLS
jgi:hypothetical protein